MILQIELPPGGKLDNTARLSGAAAAILRAQPEVTDTVEFVGIDSADVRQANVLSAWYPATSAKRAQKKLNSA